MLFSRFYANANWVLSDGMILQSRNTESQRMDESICIEHITTDHTVHVYGIIKSIE